MSNPDMQSEFEAELEETHAHKCGCFGLALDQGCIDLRARLRAARYPPVTTTVDGDLGLLYDMAQPPALRELGFGLWVRDKKWQWDTICDRIKRQVREAIVEAEDK